MGGRKRASGTQLDIPETRCLPSPERPQLGARQGGQNGKETGSSTREAPPNASGIAEVTDKYLE